MPTWNSRCRGRGIECIDSQAAENATSEMAAQPERLQDILDALSPEESPVEEVEPQEVQINDLIGNMIKLCFTDEYLSTGTVSSPSSSHGSLLEEAKEMLRSNFAASPTLAALLTKLASAGIELHASFGRREVKNEAASSGFDGTFHRRQHLRWSSLCLDVLRGATRDNGCFRYLWSFGFECCVSLCMLFYFSPNDEVETYGDKSNLLHRRLDRQDAPIAMKKVTRITTYLLGAATKRSDAPSLPKRSRHGLELPDLGPGMPKSKLEPSKAVNWTSPFTFEVPISSSESSGGSSEEEVL